jgi:simple sugar transport system permease protein
VHDHPAPTAPDPSVASFTPAGLSVLGLRALPFVWAALLAMACTSLLSRLFSADPRAVYHLFFVGTWGSVYGIGQVLFKTTPLLLTGLSVALAQRAGLFNVGGEGQLAAGALAMALCGAYLPSSLPGVVAVPLCLCAGFVGGATIGGLAGLLRWLAGAHEVIVTILLNFIVRALLVGLGGVLYVKESVHTTPIVDAARLPRLSQWLPSLHGSALNATLWVGVLVVLLYAAILRRSHLGFALRAVGQNPDAAAAAGLAVGRLRTLAMALSGGLAGLGGANFVLGYKHYYEDGFSAGLGYLGIAVAVLGQGKALGVLVAALLFGTLSQGGLAVNAQVPRELIDVLSAVVILAVATASPEVRRLLSRLPQRLRAPSPPAASHGGAA